MHCPQNYSDAAPQHYNKLFAIYRFKTRKNSLANLSKFSKKIVKIRPCTSLKTSVLKFIPLKICTFVKIEYSLYMR